MSVCSICVGQENSRQKNPEWLERPSNRYRWEHTICCILFARRHLGKQRSVGWKSIVSRIVSEFRISILILEKQENDFSHTCPSLASCVGKESNDWSGQTKHHECHAKKISFVQKKKVVDSFPYNVSKNSSAKDFFRFLCRLAKIVGFAAIFYRSGSQPIESVGLTGGLPHIASVIS